jgi:hypothetical protein
MDLSLFGNAVILFSVFVDPLILGNTTLYGIGSCWPGPSRAPNSRQYEHAFSTR